MATLHGQAQTCSTRLALFAINELNLDIPLKTVNFFAGGHKDPEYIAKLHPFGQVPVYTEGDFTLIESRAIARYLNATHGGALVPTDHKAAAVMEEWVAIGHGMIYPAVVTILDYSIWAPYKALQPDEAVCQTGVKQLTTPLNFLEKQLSDGRPFIAGEHVSLADVFIFPSFELVVHQVPQYGKLVLQGRPHVQEWVNRVQALPSWQKILAMANA